MHTRAHWFAVCSVFFLLACGPSERHEGEAPIDHFERDLGGARGVMDFFASHSDDEIREMLDGYDIGYVTQGLITDCPQFYPSSDRNTWHSLSGELYYVDESGRPSRASADLPPIASMARMQSCQSKIGRWGDAEDPSNDYDGGHLIGAQLGGWGGRANIVPQDANFNQGNWVALENKMARCDDLRDGELNYYITVSYASSTKLVPKTFGMEITNNDSGDSVALVFSNTDKGGSNGTSEKDRGLSFLSAQGCN